MYSPKNIQAKKIENAGKRKIEEEAKTAGTWRKETVMRP
jgi:hypothetical protein